ncbi:MAG: alpha-L-rhamnosidase [Alistipes sp.]|nr:alpha-L-rhamnosidase [Alistipes sp.]
MKSLFRIIILSLAVMSAVAVEAQQRDPRVRKYITPTRIVWMGDESQITHPEYLLREGVGQADLTNSHICVMRSTKTAHPAILLDFGRELHGALQIVTGMPGDHTPVRVRVRFGESASEAMCDITKENGATNDHAVRDFEITLPWLGLREVGNSGFRFARIDVLDDDCELHLKEVRAISYMRDIPYLGAFRSSDERLNKIWQTGAYTVHLNMQEYLWDGIKRDRLVWMGDLHPEVMTVSYVFGNNEVVPRSLDLVKATTKLPNWMNGISSYSIWWIIIQRDWYYHHGDLEYLKQQKEYLVDLLKLLFTKVDERGVERLDSRFLDWPSNAHPEAIHAGLQSLMLIAMQSGSELCEILGEDALAKECQQMYEKMKAAAPIVSQTYLNSGKAVADPGNKQGAALLTIAGLMDAQKANDEILTQEGVRGFSTFYGYYMLQAMAKAGNYEGAMEMIRNYWGAMLDLGATSFWEDFDIDWMENAARIDELVPEGKVDVHRDKGAYCYVGYRHSFCHGWASGPTAWLSQHILGVEILEPGCRKVRITPHLGDLEWVEGRFPTPYGEIEIAHRKSADGKIVSKVKAPKGVKVVK